MNDSLIITFVVYSLFLSLTSLLRLAMQYALKCLENHFVLYPSFSDPFFYFGISNLTIKTVVIIKFFETIVPQPMVKFLVVNCKVINLMLPCIQNTGELQYYDECIFYRETSS